VDLHAWISVGTLVVAVTLFIGRWIPLEATALGIPVVLAVTGTLAPEQCLQGFGNQAVIALGGIFILGAGLQEAGVATLVARGLERLGGRSPTRIILIVMIAVAILSAFMSNAATVAVFLPAVAVLSRRTGIVPSRLLMPLSYAAILGGTLTLIGTTPNLILGNELRLRTGEGLSLFEFTPIGGAITAVGIAFMAFVGWRMLPRRDPSERLVHAQLPEDLARRYDLARNLYRMKVLPKSKVAGTTIAEAGIGRDYGLEVLLVTRAGPVGTRSFHPRPDLALRVGDELFLEGATRQVWRMADEQTLQFGLADAAEIDRILGRGVTLAEVTPSPRSGALGRTFKELDFRKRFGLNVVAAWRGKRASTSGMGDRALKLGDAFLVSGRPEHVREVARDPDFLVLGDGSARQKTSSEPPSPYSFSSSPFFRLSSDGCHWRSAPWPGRY
jgi:di/tricarboxylate transporter